MPVQLREVRRRADGVSHLTLLLWGGHGILSQQCWRDTKTKRLEDHLGKVAVAILATLIALGERQDQERLRRAQEEQERLQLEEVTNLQAAKYGWAKILDEQAHRWEQNRILNRFITACEGRMQNSMLRSDSDAGRWLTWAKGHVRELDPFNSASPQQKSIDSILAAFNLGACSRILP